MLPRLVLFDIDGTLLDLQGAGGRSLDQALLEICGKRRMSERTPFHGRQDPEIVADILNRHGEPKHRIPAIIDRYLELLAVRLQRNPPCVLPGVRAFLEHLRALPHLTLGLVTGNVRAGANVKLKAAGLWELFQVGAFGDESLCRAELVRLARQRAAHISAPVATNQQASGAVHADHVVFMVGDTTNDVLAAHEAGVVAVAVATGVVPREELAKARPAWLLDSLEGCEALLESLVS